MANAQHIPVLLDEVLEFLAIKPGGNYLDCTFGRGGHARAILGQLGPQGRLWATDRDPAAAEAGRLLVDPRFHFRHVRFSRAASVIEEVGLAGKLDGVLLDFGVSSPQLDDHGRGFSFQAEGPLDMRMDTSCGESAADWLASASQADIERCLFEFGEERHARRIARRICTERSRAPLQTTTQLAALVAGAVPRSGERIHPATRTFQALRIRVNDELQEIASALPALAHVLAPGGRLCAISFHSLEDRIVKRYFRDRARQQEDFDASARRYAVLTRKPVGPSEAECLANPRSRSAHLRVLERLA